MGEETVRLLKQRFYYDKNSGIALLCLSFLILPLAVILAGVSLAGSMLGFVAFVFCDANIAFRLFLILFIAAPVPTIWGIIRIIKICVKRPFLYLQYIEIDDEGVTSKFFSNVQKHWSWNEIAECGVGWEFMRLPKDNRPLPEGEEKFVYDMFKYRHISGTKYIFFIHNNHV